MIKIIDGIEIKNNQRKKGTIFSENDFRFLLLRHWNLYDSIYYSNFMASRLNIWKE